MTLRQYFYNTEFNIKYKFSNKLWHSRQQIKEKPILSRGDVRRLSLEIYRPRSGDSDVLRAARRCLRATDGVAVVYSPRLENRVYRKETTAVVADAQCAVTTLERSVHKWSRRMSPRGVPHLRARHSDSGCSLTRAFYTANRIKPIA